ncbi:hypothetical protein LV779_17635 [Streptomyces thinghirensis]|nr:hypothetical protein [Streptomyces thinghirensis]
MHRDLRPGTGRPLPPDEVVVFTSAPTAPAPPEAPAASAEPGGPFPYPVIRHRARTLLPTPRATAHAASVARRYGCDRGGSARLRPRADGGPAPAYGGCPYRRPPPPTATRCGGPAPPAPGACCRRVGAWRWTR